MAKGEVDRNVILDAYAQALLGAKSKGMIGDTAKVAARNAAARVLTKAFGTTVTPEKVADVVARS
jgi:2C-methyl-D-erythritol 2,4-cyclodiphosphate synthase